METAKQADWRYSAVGSAAVVALGLTFCVAPHAVGAREVCAGNCDSGGTVTVDEIITLVNIALGSAPPSACPAGIPPGRDVDITLIVEAVGNALAEGCGKCGNGEVDPGETCDDGGTCTGGTNAGTHCTAETDCTGNGICVGGTKVYFACADDRGCPGGTCVRCKTFGGDGCAANCTLETDVTMKLVPGVVRPIDPIIRPGTSGAVVYGDMLAVPLPLAGSQVVTIGEQGASGEVPAIVKANSIQFPSIPVSAIACACWRGVAAKTCGGTLYDIDAVTPSEDCTEGFTAGDTVCTTKGLAPCSFLHGPGNAASGVVGCGAAGYSPVDILVVGGGSGTPITLSGSGPSGSALFLSNNAIGAISGECTGTDAANYGNDGAFCTDDDPQDVRGDPSPRLNVTGTATGKIENANGVDGDGLGPFSVTGSPFSCDVLLSNHHRFGGGCLAGVSVSLNFDTIVTSLMCASAAGSTPTPGPAACRAQGAQPAGLCGVGGDRRQDPPDAERARRRESALDTSQSSATRTTPSPPCRVRGVPTSKDRAIGVPSPSRPRADYRERAPRGAERRTGLGS
jgi:hypothetical protein